MVKTLRLPLILELDTLYELHSNPPAVIRIAARLQYVAHFRIYGTLVITNCGIGFGSMEHLN